MNLYAVIIAGGSGERLWPLSTPNRPKQFLALIDQEPLIKNTLKRLKGLLPGEKIFIQTTPSCQKKLSKLLPGFRKRIWVEPEGKDTGPAVALAALRLHLLDPSSTMLTLWSDHFIGKPKILKRAFREAAAIANRGDLLVNIGIRPSRPETTLGYIELGEKIPGSNAFRVSRFKEKPSLKTAQKYLKEKNFLWNAGLFAWQTKNILAAFERSAPEIFRPLMEIKKIIQEGSSWQSEKVQKAFSKMPKRSIDYAVSEKAENIVAVEADPAWDDIGSWQRLYALLPKDKGGNAIRGETKYLESQNSLIINNSNRQKVATIGIKDLIVVVTEDTVLVADKKTDPAKIRTLKKLEKKKR